jgi:hypothetical protein
MTIVQELPATLCACGCGAPAPLAQRNNRRLGQVKGQALPCISGHNARGRVQLDRWHEEDRGYLTPCHIWDGSVNHKGYGRAQVNGEHTCAHRAIWERDCGSLPRSVHLDHLCRQLLCVRRSHLEPVTAAENNRRAARARAHAAAWDALNPTVSALQDSAIDLFTAMIRPETVS